MKISLLSLVASLLLVSTSPLFAQTSVPDLFEAARGGTVEQVKAAIAAGGSLTAVQTSDGLTALHFAARYNKPDVAQALIDAGSSLTKRDAAGMSLLFNALEFNPDLKMAQLFLRQGNRLTDRDGLGGTALIRAVLNPNIEVFRFVLAQKGMSVNDKDAEGTSVLSWALLYASPEVVQTLLKAGAAVNVKDSRGITPLMVAAGADSGGTKIAMLLKAGARLEERFDTGGTALTAAVGNRDLAAARALVAAGARTDVRDNAGATLLMSAALFNTNPAMVSYLLTLGQDLNAVDKENKTALNWAAGNQNPEVRQALRSQGAVETPAALITTPRAVSPLPEGTWVVRSDGGLSAWLQGAWVDRPGTASAVAQRAGALWSLGFEATEGNFALRRWNGSEWEATGAVGRRLAVGTDGQPWLVDATGVIRRLVNGGWTVVPGKATDIGVGADGTVWIIGTTPVGDNFEILKSSGGKWVKTDGAAVQVAVDPQGNPWVINAAHKAYSRPKGKWSAVDLWGAKAVGIGSDGTVVLALNENGVSPDFQVLDGKVLMITGTNSIALP